MEKTSEEKALDLRALALGLYREGLVQFTPEVCVRRALRLENEELVVRLGDTERRFGLPAQGVHLVAIGKAAAPMASEAARVLEGRVAQGLIVTKYEFSLADSPFPQRETGHPLPDAAGVAAAEEVERIAAALDADALLLVLLSGGASALLPAPRKGLSLAEKQTLGQAMLHSGMDIHQMNRVRKALSRLKGGGLAACAAPAQTVCLCISDVPGDALGSIGSGPTVPEPSDPAGVIALLREFNLWEGVPQAVQQVISTLPEASPMPQPPPYNGIIAANADLLAVMAQQAHKKGFDTQVLAQPITGLNHAAQKDLLRHWHTCCEQSNAARLCLIAGGETTVEVRGSGRGGRCQDLAAWMMSDLEAGEVFLAAGSDGNDGPTDAAGGVVDRESWLRVQRNGIPRQSLLENHDSYSFLERSGNLIRIPPSRNNLMDLYLFLKC